jgi:hypothetical protein
MISLSRVAGSAEVILVEGAGHLRIAEKEAVQCRPLALLLEA